MTKKQIIERDENGQPIIDVAQEEIKAEIQVSINKLLKKRDEAKEKYGKLKRTTFEVIEDKGLIPIVCLKKTRRSRPKNLS